MFKQFAESSLFDDLRIFAKLTLILLKTVPGLAHGAPLLELLTVCWALISVPIFFENGSIGHLHIKFDVQITLFRKLLFVHAELLEDLLVGSLDLGAILSSSVF